MNSIDLITQLNNYHPHNEQEARDLPIMLDWLEKCPDAFLRTNEIAHVTASGWVVNKEHTKVLMCYHNIYHSWSWMGGHADGETDLLSVAIREVKEESGLTKVTPISNLSPFIERNSISSDIFTLEILTVDGHIKKGVYVPSHLHLNFTYLLEADETEELKIKPDENSGVAWFTPEEALAKSTEPWMVEHVYKKCVEKVGEYLF